LKPKRKISPAKSLKKQGTNKDFKTAQFKPGQSGNPNGRPKGGKNIPDLLRKFGAWPCPDVLITKMLLHPETRELVEAEMKPKLTATQLYRLADKVRRGC